MSDAISRWVFARSSELLRYQTLFKVLNTGITGAVYIFYPAFLIWTFITGRDMFWGVLLVPLSGFVLLSVVRYLINAPRPYEVYGLPPLISKNTRGKSFPSRHVFCIFVIAMAALRISIIAGCIILFAGVILAAVRVLTGVHFLRDVMAGAISAILYSLIIYWRL